MKQQRPYENVIQFPKSGEHPESAFVDWIHNQYTLEEIKGFILHQFNPEYFVNQRKFHRYVKLCKLVNIDKHSKEKVELKMKHAQKNSPTSERMTLKYNEPFIAVPLSYQDCHDK
jgi:hypothetical protein